MLPSPRCERMHLCSAGASRSLTCFCSKTIQTFRKPRNKVDVSSTWQSPNHKLHPDPGGGAGSFLSSQDQRSHAPLSQQVLWLIWKLLVRTWIHSNTREHWRRNTLTAFHSNCSVFNYLHIILKFDQKLQMIKTAVSFMFAGFKKSIKISVTVLTRLSAKNFFF